MDVTGKTFAGQGLVGLSYKYGNDPSFIEEREIVEPYPGLMDGWVMVTDPDTGEKHREKLAWVLGCISEAPEGSRFKNVSQLLTAFHALERQINPLAGEVLRSDSLSQFDELLRGFHDQMSALTEQMKTSRRKLVQQRLSNDFDEEVGGETLYHATTKENAAEIMARGFNAGTCFTNNLSLVDYYWDTIRDEGNEPVVLKVSVAEVLSVVPEDVMVPDMPSIDEPITTVLRKSEDAIQDDWQDSGGTWKDGLRISGAVKCMSAIPAELVSLDDDDISLDVSTVAP